VEWIDALRGETVGLDTAPLIYFMERHPVRATKLKPFFAAAQQREFRIVTSLVTLLEVPVHPLRHGREDFSPRVPGHPIAFAKPDRPAAQ
jgi:hypothetical protein